VELSSNHVVQSVMCNTPNNKNVQFQAEEVILAAGPWTENLFKSLFPRSRVDLQFKPIAEDYVIFKTPQPLVDQSLSAVFMDNIVGHKLEFAGRNDGTIWSCVQINQTASLPPPGTQQQPDPNMFLELLAYARRFIQISNSEKKSEEECLQADVQVIAQGRGFRPSTRSGLPVIAAVPRSRLHDGLAFGDGGDGNSGVYICSGHGSYGMLLGMGSAKLMAQVVLGERPDIDLDGFGVGSEEFGVKS
jgi:glycine/D-amino acid oxidase-like deaminating enzyme